MRSVRWVRPAVAVAAALTVVSVVAAFPLAARAFNSKVKGAPVPYGGFSAQGPTGLRIVAFQVPVSLRSTLGVSYRAGSADDPPGKEGMAHLVEHLAFRARPGGGQRIWDRLEAAGVEFNAYTTADHTTYYAAGRKDQLVEMADAEAARLRDPLAGIDENDFETERDVVLSELRQRRDHSPSTTQVEWLAEVGMAGHPYGRSVVGTEQSLRSITLADARAWVKQHYVPAAAVAVLCSPLPAKEAASAFAARFDQSFFGSGPGAPRVAPVVRVPPPLPKLPEDLPLARKVGPAERPTLWVGWILPGGYAKQGPRAIAASAYVEALVGSALLSQKDGSGERYVDSVSGDLWEMDGATLVFARITLRDEKDARWAFDKVKGALFHAKDSQGYMGQFSRDALLVEHYMALERSTAVGAVAQHLRAHGDADYLSGWSRLVGSQLTEGIDDYLRENFRGERTFGLLVTPDPNPRVPSADAATGDLPPPSFDGAWTPPARSVLEVARAPGFDKVQRRRLANGLEVVVARWGAAPVAEVTLAFRADLDGTAALPAGAASLARSLMTSPAHGLDKVQYGIQTWRRSGPGWTKRVERGSAGNLDMLVEFMGRWARRSSMGEGLSRVKDERVRALGYEHRRPAVLAQDELFASLFPGSPLGARVDEASVRSVTSSQVDAWFDATFRPERAVLLVVSSIEPDAELWSAIESEFGGWSGSGKATEPVSQDPAPPPARRVVLVDQPGATQPLLRVGVASPPRAARDDAARDTLSSYLSWTLQRHLRMERGVTYGISAHWLDRGFADPLVVEAAVADDALVPTLNAVLQGLAAAAAMPAPDVDVQRARWQVARSLALGFDTVDAASAELADLYLRQRPVDYWEKYPASLAGVTPARVQAAAAALAIGKEAVVIVGDARTLQPKLQAAGIPVAEVVRAEAPSSAAAAGK